MTSTARHDGRGQALVEFALVFPIFVLLLVGLFDLGRAVFYQSTIQNASREAVRLAIVDQSLTAIQEEAIDSVGVVVQVAASDVTVQYLAPDLTATGSCPSQQTIGCVAQVTVQYQFVPVIPFVPQFTLSATTNQPIERHFTSP
jgi:Flp pilus assembly protein TadG